MRALEAPRQALRKLLFVLMFGAVFGMLELFGRDALRAVGVEHKSALLYGLGIIILYASKRVVHFPGSVVIMAIIAGLFKTASRQFLSLPGRRGDDQRDRFRYRLLDVQRTP